MSQQRNNNLPGRASITRKGHTPINDPLTDDPPPGSSAAHALICSLNNLVQANSTLIKTQAVFLEIIERLKAENNSLRHELNESAQDVTTYPVKGKRKNGNQKLIGNH